MKKRFNWFINLTKQQENRRQRILRNMITFLMVLIAAIVIFTILNISGFIDQRVNSNINEKVQETNEEFMKSIDMVEDDLTMIVKWLKSGSLSLKETDQDGLNSRLIPLFEEIQFIKALSINEGDSVFYFLQKEDDLWQGSLGASDKLIIDNLENLAYKDYFDIVKNINGEFLDKVKDADFHWVSNPGDDFLVCQSVIDVALGEENKIFSLMLFIDLPSMLDYVIKEEGQDIIIRIIEGDQQFIPAEISDNTNVKSVIEIDTTGSRQSLIDSAMKHWLLKQNSSNEIFSFHFNSKTWWGAVEELELDMLSYRILVIQSQTSFARETIKERNSFAVIGFIIMLVSIIGLLGFIRRYNRNLNVMEHSSIDDSEYVAGLIKKGEGDFLEFKSTLRWNLKANKPTREIELSVLKTIVAFMNTSGGILLVGVDDKGDAIGIDADNFPNGDKYLLHFNNMIKAHIGLEYAGLINFKLIEYQGKLIMAVKCEVSDDPIFLKFEDTEDFYIRVGPGSRKLTTKRAVKYIRDREEKQRH